MDSQKVAGTDYVINLVTPDNDEKFVVELSNSVLTSIVGHQAKEPNLTITLDRTELEKVMIGEATFDDLLKDGKAKFEGDRKGFDAIRAAMTIFTPTFEMMPGTAPKEPAKASKKPLEAHPPAETAGG